MSRPTRTCSHLLIKEDNDKICTYTIFDIMTYLLYTIDNSDYITFFFTTKKSVANIKVGVN